MIAALLALQLSLAACEHDASGKRDVQVRLQRIFDDREFQQPVEMVQAPDDNSSWYVVERAGRVYRGYQLDSSNMDLFVDLTDRVDASFSESGLLGMAFLRISQKTVTCILLIRLQGIRLYRGFRDLQ